MGIKNVEVLSIYWDWFFFDELLEVFIGGNFVKSFKKMSDMEWD